MQLMGLLRQFGDVGGMSTIPPIATELVRGGERRKGPTTEVTRSLTVWPGASWQRSA
jgi:hypothetical protein